MVALKQPGAVPAGAGVAGFSTELAPLAWHLKHSGALATLVFTWLGVARVAPSQGRSGCGALVWQLLQEVVRPLS